MRIQSSRKEKLHNMVVYSGSSNPRLAASIVRALRAKLGRVEISRFPNSEIRLRVRGDLTGKDACVVQSLVDPVNDRLVEFLLLCDAVRRAGARRVFAIIPWMGYSLQSEAFRSGEPRSAEVVAKVISTAKLSGVVIVHPHTSSLVQLFAPTATAAYPTKLFAAELQRKWPKSVLIAPDKGSLAFVREVGRVSNQPVIALQKTRSRETGEVRAIVRPEDQQIMDGKPCVIVDDAINTGRTLIEAARVLRDSGAKKLACIITHGLFAGEASEKLQASAFDEIVVTDTVDSRDRKFSKLRVLPCAELLAQTLAPLV